MNAHRYGGPLRQASHDAGRERVEPLHYVDVSPNFAEVHTARELVRPFLDDDVDDNALLLVAVTELVTNAIEAHHRANVSDPIRIELDSRTQTLIIRDAGDGYDPLRRERNVRSTDSGRGLDLVVAARPGLKWHRNASAGTTFVLPLSNR